MKNKKQITPEILTIIHITLFFLWNKGLTKEEWFYYCIDEFCKVQEEKTFEPLIWWTLRHYPAEFKSFDKYIEYLRYKIDTTR